MRRILIDTNVILDLLAKREPYYMESQQLFSLADLGEMELVISSLSLVNVHYVLSESLKIQTARSTIGKFKVLVKIFELNEKILELAINDHHFKDFEDGIQYYTAVESACEAIITRNLKDFKKSSIPVMSPKEFLTSMKVSK